MNIPLEKLLETTISEEQYFIEAHQKRIQFYSSLISAILAATVAGFLKAEMWYQYAFLIVGPVMTISLSSIAMGGTYRLYQRFLEAVVMRAKVEQMSGMHETNSTEGAYWEGESLVPTRHHENRTKHSTSKNFIEAYKNEGYQKSTRHLLFVFQAVSIVLILGLSGMTSAKYFAQQDGANQPATAEESKAESEEKPKLESDGGSQ